MAQLSKEALQEALIQRHGKENQEKFNQAVVGIAGLGGLGSNVAMYLTRLGVGKLILVDFDVVDISNLNRQNYFMTDIGRPKTEALLPFLQAINPYLDYDIHTQRVTADNAISLFSECDVLVEAFDREDQKAMLTETILSQLPDIPLVGASGMAGADSGNKICVKKPFKSYYLCGDGTSDVNDGLGLMAPRVALCAAQQATMVMRLLIGETEV